MMPLNLTQCLMAVHFDLQNGFKDYLVRPRQALDLTARSNGGYLLDGDSAISHPHTYRTGMTIGDQAPRQNNI